MEVGEKNGWRRDVGQASSLSVTTTRHCAIGFCHRGFGSDCQSDLHGDNSSFNARSLAGSPETYFTSSARVGRLNPVTMQVASLIDPEPRVREGMRAWWQKRNQARLARAIEARWTKEQILEAYVNLLHLSRGT